MKGQNQPRYSIVGVATFAGGSGGDASSITGNPGEFLYFDAVGNGTGDTLAIRNSSTKETQIAFDVSASGFVTDSFGDFAVVKADNPGFAGNSITLTFDGVVDVDTALATWNAANPSNTGTVIQGLGTIVPDPQTLILGGGGEAGYNLSLDLLGQGIEYAGDLITDGANYAALNGLLGSTGPLNPFMGAFDFGTGEASTITMQTGNIDINSNDAATNEARINLVGSSFARMGYFPAGGNGQYFYADNTSLRLAYNGYQWYWATADGSSGDVLTTDGAGNLSFQPIPPATATLTDTYIGVGNSSNQLDGYSRFTYNPANYFFRQAVPNNINGGVAIGSPLTFSTASFAGSGPDDLTLNWSIFNYQSEKYGGNLTIQIDGNGTPDTFYWIYTGSYSQVLGGGTGGLPILPGPMSLTDVNGNIIAEITFGSTTGHTIGDTWTAGTSLGGLGWGMLLTDQDGHEFIKVNTVIGSYFFGDDNTPTALSGNGTRIQITDQLAELGLYAKRYFRVEAPGGNTAVLADMQNDTWANYTDEFTIKNVTGLSTFFTLNTSTPSMTAAVSIAEIGNNGVGNNTYWQLSDTSTTSFLRADTAIRNRTFLWEAGDLATAGNGTKVSINDTTQKTTITSKQTIITGGIATSKYRNGGNSTPIAIVDGDYIVYAGSGSIGATFNLPAASSLDDGYTVIVKDYFGLIPGSGSFYVAPNGTDTIDGLNSSYQLLTQYQSITLVLNKSGSNWMII